MAHLIKDLSTDSAYIDRNPMKALTEMERVQYEEKYRQRLRESKTVYVGNLSFAANEDIVHELFSSVGVVKDIIMGLDRLKKAPCGFCFVEYDQHAYAEDAVRYLNARNVCGRPGNVRKENRYWGRGASGGQVRDEYRTNYDPERGGLGVRVLEKMGGGAGVPAAAASRGYGAWAYTAFNTHEKRTSKRSREQASNDPLYRDFDPKPRVA